MIRLFTLVVFFGCFDTRNLETRFYVYQFTVSISFLDVYLQLVRGCGNR